MKKTLILLAILAVFATGCKKDKSKSLNYNDSNPIEMVLQGYHQIQATSDYDITYKAINNNSNIEVVTVDGSGKIYGKNVGSGQVKISNGYEDQTVDVNVALFREPTFDFGCNTSKIRDLYGRPLQSSYISDTILVYQYTASQGYSYACGEMDFFFYNGAYYESDVYIRPSVEYLLNNYLNDNFRLDTIMGDTLSVYRHKIYNDIICGKFASHNQWNEWCLFYIQANQEKSVANILKRRPRSSKLR